MYAAYVALLSPGVLLGVSLFGCWRWRPRGSFWEIRSDRGLGTWALAQISIGCAGLSLTEAAGFAASEIRGCKTSASRGLGHRCQADGSAVDGDHARVAKQRCLPGQCRAQLVPTALVQSTAAAYRAGVPGVGECSTGAVICIQYVCLAG
jgi:hypothetical protein